MSDDPIRTRIDQREQVHVLAAKPQTVDFKPQGFWYSVDEDWERWCRSEQPDWLEGHHTHYVFLGKERLVYIKDVLELDAFHKRYKANPFIHIGLSTEYIDWRLVAAEYDGIEIAPYLWERRLMGPPHSWYYSWDCASGCVWRPRGIQVKLKVGVLDWKPKD
jgi:hypothetical protein